MTVLLLITAWVERGTNCTTAVHLDQALFCDVGKVINKWAICCVTVEYCQINVFARQ